MPGVPLSPQKVLVPGLQQYWSGAAGDKFPRPRVDGGYYTRTPENLPLIGKQLKIEVFARFWHLLLCDTHAGPAPLRGGSSASQVQGMYVCGALRYAQ